mmetsp:Transcript_8055/g.29895  ORF Transcript_8055/g.29895 Transcript_8055/m.29895 type:complete len:641 (+) Transcript_8055:2424-4346(+)
MTPLQSSVAFTNLASQNFSPLEIGTTFKHVGEIGEKNASTFSLYFEKRAIVHSVRFQAGAVSLPVEFDKLTAQIFLNGQLLHSQSLSTSENSFLIAIGDEIGIRAKPCDRLQLQLFPENQLALVSNQIVVLGVDATNRKYTALKMRDVLLDSATDFSSSLVADLGMLPVVKWLFEYDLMEALFIPFTQLCMLLEDTLKIFSTNDSDWQYPQYVIQANRFNHKDSQSPTHNALAMFVERIAVQENESLVSRKYNAFVESILVFSYTYCDEVFNFQQREIDARFIDQIAPHLSTLLDMDNGEQDAEMIGRLILSWPPAASLRPLTNELYIHRIIDMYLNDLWKIGFFAQYDNVNYFVKDNPDLLTSNLLTNIRDGHGMVPQPLKNVFLHIFKEAGKGNSRKVISSLFREVEEKELEIALVLSHWGDATSEENQYVVQPLYQYLFNNCIRESPQLLKDLLGEWFTKEQDKVITELCIWHLGCYKASPKGGSVGSSIDQENNPFRASLPVLLDIVEDYVLRLRSSGGAQKSVVSSDLWGYFRKCLLFYREKCEVEKHLFREEQEQKISSLLSRLIQAMPDQFIEEHINMSLRHSYEIGCLRDDVDRLLQLTNIPRVIKKERRKKNGYKFKWDPEKQKYVECTME